MCSKLEHVGLVYIWLKAKLKFQKITLNIREKFILAKLFWVATKNKYLKFLDSEALKIGDSNLFETKGNWNYLKQVLEN